MLAWVSIAIFLATLAVFVTDRLHRSVVALVGAVAMVAAGALFGFYSEGQAFAAIDFHTLGLLLGMMVLADLLSKTGLFEYLALVAAQHSKGLPWRLMVLLCSLTAILSMFINNIPAMMLIGPVTIMVAHKLRASPVPFLIGEALFSNLGGTATLIGDPPNMLIGSAAGYTFNDFLLTLFPIVAVTFLPTLWALHSAFGKETWRRSEETDKLERLRPTEIIKDYRSLVKLVAVLALVLVLFALQNVLHLQPAFLVLAGVALALLLLLPHSIELVQDAEWNMLVFFTCLFVLVGGLEAAGVIKFLAAGVAELARNHMLLAAILLIWIAAVMSALVDNIPFAVATVSILKTLQADGLHVEPLWWALALGIGLGGSGTPFGASANIIALRYSERAGYPISFPMWTRSASVAALVSCVVATAVFAVMFGLIKS